MPTPRSSSRPAHGRVATRSIYARGNADFLVNDPDGYPSEYGPVYWMGSDVWGPGPIGPHGPGSVDVIPAVTRIVAVIVDPLASVPWKVVEQGFGGDTLGTPRWLTDPQLLRPDDRYPSQILPAVSRSPRTQVWSTLLRSAVLFGIGFLAFVEDQTGQPTAGSVRTLHPWMVNPVRDDGGTLVWEVGTGADVLRADRDGRIEIGGLLWRIVALRDPHSPVDEDGHSINVFERHPDTFGTADAIERYARSSFSGDGVPSGFLKVNTPGLTQPQASDLKAAWMAAHSGARRSVAILNATTDYTPLSRSPLDMALVETKRASLADLAFAFSLDPNGALGISMGNSATYANVGQYFSRLKMDLLPWIEITEQVFSSLLPAGQGVLMDFSELSRPDPKEHYEALSIAVAAGLFTLDEARNALGLPPAPPPPKPDPVPPQLEPATAPEAAPPAPAAPVDGQPAARHLRPAALARVAR